MGKRIYFVFIFLFLFFYFFVLPPHSPHSLTMDEKRKALPAIYQRPSRRIELEMHLVAPPYKPPHCEPFVRRHERVDRVCLVFFDFSMPSCLSSESRTGIHQSATNLVPGPSGCSFPDSYGEGRWTVDETTSWKVSVLILASILQFSLVKER